MSNLRKINDLPLLEEVPENATVVIDDGGVAKRVKGSNLGGGASAVNVVFETADMENFACTSHTFAELKELMLAGSLVSAKVYISSMGMFVSASTGVSYFFNLAAQQEMINTTLMQGDLLLSVTFYPDESVTFETYTLGA